MAEAEAKRSPGRPKKDDAAIEAARELRRQQEERRRTMTDENPRDISYRLQIPKEKLETDRFKYRWVNDDDARIYRFEQAEGWMFVHQRNGEIMETADRGSAVNKTVGKHENGSPKPAYLMRKPIEWWREDQMKKRQKIEKQFAEAGEGFEEARSTNQRSATYHLPSNNV